MNKYQQIPQWGGIFRCERKSCRVSILPFGCPKAQASLESAGNSLIGGWGKFCERNVPSPPDAVDRREIIGNVCPYNASLPRVLLQVHADGRPVLHVCFQQTDRGAVCELSVDGHRLIVSNNVLRLDTVCKAIAVPSNLLGHH